MSVLILEIGSPAFNELINAVRTETIKATITQLKQTADNWVNESDMIKLVTQKENGTMSPPTVRKIRKELRTKKTPKGYLYYIPSITAYLEKQDP
jgi:hypothetical protein